MDERQQELLSLYNIVKSNGQYELQHNYYIDGERIVPVIPLEISLMRMSKCAATEQK